MSARERVEFTALDYHADDSFREARYRFEGDAATGWTILRDGRPALELRTSR